MKSNIALLSVLVFLFVGLMIFYAVPVLSDTGDGGGIGGGGGGGGGREPPCHGACCNPLCTSSSDCPQSTSTCSGNQTGTRSSYGSCSLCSCSSSPFSYSCVPGSCGAQCSSNGNCPETTSACNGNLTGTRPSLGTCGSGCSCSYLPFSYTCVPGTCGAQCNVNSDCQNKCVGSVRYFSGTCGSGSCSCSYQTQDCSQQSGWYDTSNFTCSGSCQQCKTEEFRVFGCSPGTCTYSVNQTRQVCQPAPSGQRCDSSTNTFTSSGSCGTSSPYCANGCSVSSNNLMCDGNNNCSQVVSTNSTFCPANTACSNGVCSSTTSCGSSGGSCIDSCNLAGQLFRCNGWGGCSNFWQYSNQSSCNPYSCSSGSCTSTCNTNCGAACNSGDMQTKNVTCTTSQNCAGTKTQQRVCQNSNCQFGNWADTTSCQDIPGDNCPQSCGDGVIGPGEQCELPNTQYNPNCIENTSACSGNQTGVRNAFGNCNGQCQCNFNPFTYSCVKGTCGAACNFGEQQTKNVTCTGSFGCLGTLIQQSTCDQNCQFNNFQNISQCQTLPGCPPPPGGCTGNIFLSANTSACPNNYVTILASGFSVGCGDPFIVHFKEGSCSGNEIARCTVNRDGNCQAAVSYSDTNNHAIYGCVDINNDGNFNSPGESSSITINENCNNCNFYSCTPGVCNSCAQCGGPGGSYSNPYNANKCVNADQGCPYSCVTGQCGTVSCPNSAPQQNANNPTNGVTLLNSKGCTLSQLYCPSIYSYCSYQLTRNLGTMSYMFCDWANVRVNPGTLLPGQSLCPSWDANNGFSSIVNCKVIGYPG